MLNKLKQRFDNRLKLIVRSAVNDVVETTVRREASALAAGRLTDSRQLESLVGLYSTLDIQIPLPPTRLNAASPDLLAEIARTVLSERPKVAVEMGAGISTIITAYALKKNGAGHLYTLEHDGDWAERARGYLKAHGLSEWATILHRPLAPVSMHNLDVEWYEFSADELGVDAIDLLVIDGPPAWDETNENNRFPAVPVLANLLRNGATIIVDDMVREGEQRALAKWNEIFGPLDIYEPPADKGMAIITWNK